MYPCVLKRRPLRQDPWHPLVLGRQCKAGPCPQLAGTKRILLAALHVVSAPSMARQCLLHHPLVCGLPWVSRLVLIAQMMLFVITLQRP